MTRIPRILLTLSIAAAFLPTLAAHAAEWPRIAGQGTDWVNSLNEPQWPSFAAQAERRFASPWAFEVGARYWYSTGTTKFGFTNGHPLAGSPTSTLDWNKTQGHAGEIFGRIDHKPSSLFVKAVVGAGILRGGEFIDRDYLTYQTGFSDTTSQVHGDNLRYATIDVGYSYELPRYGVRFGGFVGYHYWHEKTTAYGLVCNASDIVWPGMTCVPPGTLLYPYSTPVLVYEPTWHALRIGGDARIHINQRWSVSGEAALIIGWLDNKDSHLLRQDMPSPSNNFSGLGPAPNILTKGFGYGGMAEVFVNYAVTPNLEAGLGLRYWGINAVQGRTTFGPDFSRDYQLDYFDQSRWGLLAQVKGKF